MEKKEIYISFSEDMEEIIFQGIPADINPVEVILELLTKGEVINNG